MGGFIAGSHVMGYRRADSSLRAGDNTRDITLFLSVGFEQT